MKLYLDNCCYNRPFDDQTNLAINLETQAKLQIQADIKNGKYKLVWSYVLDFENANNPYESRRISISPWSEIATETITENEEIITRAEALTNLGLKNMDALHVASAIYSQCDYFLTTDKKILNKPIYGIKVMNPLDFIGEEDKSNDEN